MSGSVGKPSYIIPCASDFRDEVVALAARKFVNVADIARSVLLTVPTPAIRNFADPGGPPVGDREEIRIASGSAAGRVLKRKPRLQMRLPSGFDVSLVRRALGFALAIDRGELDLSPAPDASDLVTGDIQAQDEEILRLKTLISLLSFDLLQDGPQTRADALYILGFPPAANPDRIQLRAKYTMLASIHHPDSDYGDHMRMSQLNMAMDLLGR